MASHTVAFTVYGTEQDGTVRRLAGLTVWCGHRHKTQEAAGECLTEMTATRSCPGFRVVEMAKVGEAWQEVPAVRSRQPRTSGRGG